MVLVSNTNILAFVYVKGITKRQLTNVTQETFLLPNNKIEEAGLKIHCKQMVFPL